MWHRFTVRKLLKYGSGGGALTAAAAIARFASCDEKSGMMKTLKQPNMDKWRIEGPIKDPTDGTLITRRVRRRL